MVSPPQLETLNLEKGIAFFEDIFATEFSGRIRQTDPVWDLVEVFADGLDICAPLHPDGNMAKSIQRRGKGLGR